VNDPFGNSCHNSGDRWPPKSIRAWSNDRFGGCSLVVSPDLAENHQDLSPSFCGPGRLLGLQTDWINDDSMGSRVFYGILHTHTFSFSPSRTRHEEQRFRLVGVMEDA
jgi:hypothetical protein